MTATATRQAEDREFVFNERDFRYLAQLVGNQTGIVLAEHKRDMVYSRLARRLRALQLKTFAEYIDLLNSEDGEAEMGNFINAITTNLTSFFREPHHFDHLKDTVLANMASLPASQRKLRIWSSACSSGMEPYSIAMTLKAGLKNLDAWDARILATDIDTNMLNTASAGEYAQEQYDNIPAAYRQDVISAGKDRIRMSDDLKSLIAFKHLNLLNPWPMKGLFDVVFCRNVVIYFDKPTQTKLFSRIADQMKPDGWLYIGHSENLHKVCDRFELVGRTIYRKVS